MLRRSKRLLGIMGALLVLASVMVSLTPMDAKAQTNVGINNIIQEVRIINNQLFAITTSNVQLPLNLFVNPQQTRNCPILSLALGPIDLNLLGLLIETSAICLDITAQQGPGNLLGNLLCSISNLLNQGTPLQTVLAGLTRQQRNTLVNGLRDLLNGALNNLFAANPTNITVLQAPPNACTILNLDLGPLNLNLLGLLVQLDNCNNGPVNVTITAIPGGGLLGDLLCGGLLPAPLAAPAPATP